MPAMSSRQSLNVHSPLIDDKWRLFGGYAFDNSHPPEGFVDIKRASAGVQLVLPDFTASAAITQTVGACRAPDLPARPTGLPAIN